MPQSLSSVSVHLVFSTKDRRPWFRDKALREALHAQLGSVSVKLECPPLLVGGVEDHVHILARLGRTISQAEWVKELKRVSNLWMQERSGDNADFQWQGGYADFSVSQSNVATVKQYIANQESTIADTLIRMRSGHYCGNTGWNSTNDMFGTDDLPKPRWGILN